MSSGSAMTNSGSSCGNGSSHGGSGCVSLGSRNHGRGSGAFGGTTGAGGASGALATGLTAYSRVLGAYMTRPISSWPERQTSSAIAPATSNNNCSLRIDMRVRYCCLKAMQDWELLEVCGLTCVSDGM